MHAEKDKLIFSSLLIIALIVSVIVSCLSKGTSYDDGGNFSLTADGSGAVLIDGSGILNGTALDALLTENDLQPDDIKDLIIGDSITGLGYNTINGFNNLKTLKLGSSVVKIRNGALRNCPELKFIWIPAGTEKTAADFMYKISHCFCISDGDIGRFIKNPEKRGITVIGQVSSYDDLIRAMDEIQTGYLDCPAENLASTDPDAERGPESLTLRNGYTQYGPYADMEAGEYMVNVSGRGFKALADNDVYVNINGYTGIADVTGISAGEDMLSYRLSLSEDANGVEFCINNGSGTDIEITAVHVTYAAPPAAVRNWF